jgi:hypothetical protein
MKYIKPTECPVCKSKNIKVEYQEPRLPEDPIVGKRYDLSFSTKYFYCADCGIMIKPIKKN